MGAHKAAKAKALKRKRAARNLLTREKAAAKRAAK